MDAEKKTATKTTGKKTAEEEDRLKKLADKKTGTLEAQLRTPFLSGAEGKTALERAGFNKRSIDNPYGKKS